MAALELYGRITHAISDIGEHIVHLTEQNFREANKWHYLFHINMLHLHEYVKVISMSDPNPATNIQIGTFKGTFDANEPEYESTIAQTTAIPNSRLTVSVVKDVVLGPDTEYVIQLDKVPTKLDIFLIFKRAILSEAPSHHRTITYGKPTPNLI